MAWAGQAGLKPLAGRAAATLESNSAELSSRDAQNIRVEKVHKTRELRAEQSLVCKKQGVSKIGGATLQFWDQN